MQIESSEIVGGVLLLIAGYYVRLRVSNRSADRKEDKDRIDKLSEVIDEVESAAQEFFLLPHGEEANKHHLRINKLLKIIGRESHALSLSLDELAILNFHLKLKQKISLGDFDSKDRLPRNIQDPLFQEISDCSRQLLGQIEMSFNKKYKRSTLRTAS